MPSGEDPVYVRLLLLDLDNTLYDWVGYFVPAFGAMVETAAQILSVTPEQLKRDLRKVHRSRRNTEHPFALLESDIVRSQYPHQTRRERYQRLLPAFEAFDREKAARLRLYPGVAETLGTISTTGCLVIGHTEATHYSVRSRVKMLGLDRYIKTIYAPDPTGEPHPGSAEQGDRSPRPSADRSELQIISVDPDERKPNPALIRHILTDYGIAPISCVYVGDSLTNDIAMAAEAGVTAVWARYGTKHDPRDFAQLLEVTHWDLSTGRPSRKPDPNSYVAIDEFSELLSRFRFSGHNGSFHTHPS